MPANSLKKKRSYQDSYTISSSSSEESNDEKDKLNENEI